MIQFYSLFTLFLALFFQITHLHALDNHHVPPDLQGWKDWVMDDVKDRDCPRHYQQDSRICSYPTKIVVNLDNNRLDFNMTQNTFKDKSVVTLPSAHQTWAKEVTVNEKKAIVLDVNAKATVIVDKGVHHIAGTIDWNGGLKYLQLPHNMALVQLYKNGQEVFPLKVDKNSRLWLEEQGSDGDKKGTLSVAIYRKIIDGHPLKMQTHLHFRVSGKMRSVVLDGVTLDGFYPTAVESKLDVKITEDKKLQVEVKAGEYVVKVDSFSPENLTTLLQPSYRFSYANQESWAVESNADYRTIEIEGARAIDPSETNLPKAWKKLPLYLIEEDTKLTLKELYRSANQQQKNEWVLKRRLWLDFDGTGYSVDDRIEATIANVRRLEATNLLELGSVSINGKPTLITTLENSHQQGVELREESLNIKASSRYKGNISTLVVNGWDEVFSRVDTELYLPAGWRLFASFGSDNRTTSWVDKWDLMDIFLLLLLSISIYQLFGWGWSIFATLFLILLWHEGDAPTVVWLWILVLVALLRLIEKGRARTVLKVLLGISTAFVLLGVLQFSVYQIRTTLYPQLEHHEGGNFYPQFEKEMSLNDAVRSEPVEFANSVPPIYSKIRNKSIQNVQNNLYIQKSLPSKKKQILMQNKIDPNAVVQTGLGTPTWQWKTHHFAWQSAVGSRDKLELWLISPSLNRVLNLFKIVGLFFLLFMFLREFTPAKCSQFREKIFPSNGFKALGLVVLLAFTPLSLRADIPSQELLSELQSRLLEPPICLPNCATTEQIEIKIVDNRLFVNMSISAGTKLSVPILGNRNIWLPQRVTVNNNPNPYLQLDSKGDLWVMLEKGVHQLTLEGSIKGVEQIMLSSRLPLHNLTIQQSDGWRVSSDKKSYIEIVNMDKKAIEAKEKVQSAIEPLVKITRTFYFGLRWYIETDVKLLNRIDKPYTFAFNLLPNESILDKAIEVKNQQALLHLRDGHAHYHWRSSIPIRQRIELKSSDKEQILEVWQMDIASIWKMTHAGIEPEKSIKIGNLLLPIFKPWQKEHLILTLEKTKAVKGESLTIESSSVSVVQSQRYRDITLDIFVKSSRARQYEITLANVKELKSVKIDGTAHYLKINNQKLSLPLKAKAQKIKIKWREEINSSINYTFPSINLAKESVNSNITLNLPRNRWVLWTSGPLLGAAVLLWGVLLSVLLFAMVLGRVEGIPLKTRDWLLLGMGVSTTSVMIMLPIVIWIFALRYREHQGDLLQGWKRNLMQVSLVILTIIALGTIVGAVSVGLLGSPDMMIEGNNSTTYNLNWYSDRITVALPEPTVISVSIWYYRALMLLWAIWISFSLIKWLKWSWKIFTQGDIWVKRERKED